MRYAVLAALLCSLLAAGCSQYAVRVRRYDDRGKPVMDASIAVDGKYIAAYRKKKEKEDPILKEFFIQDEFTTGELDFGVWGLPDSIRLSASAPGFHKYVGTAQRYVHADGVIEYRLVSANPPYSLGDVRVTKKRYNIYIDAFLLQMSRGRLGGGY